MTSTPDTPAIESITDPETLRDHEDVPFHEDSDVVDEETFQTVAELDDMAPTGVRNADGEVLVMRVTETCRWKIPSSSVADGAAFAPAASEWIARNTGLDISFDGIEAVWHYEATLEGSDRTASRYFVVFGATPARPDASVPTDDADPETVAHEVGWFDELPEGGAAAPGTDLFL